MKPAADQYDAVIVGSGFGGALVAHALARAGWRVLVLERGVWARRDSLDWNPREISIRNRYGAASPILVRQYGARRFSRVFPPALVGGQSVLYGGASLRLREADLARWPLSYAELEPYYARAEEILGVHGAATDAPWEPPRLNGYPFPPGALTAPALRLQQAARQLGYSPQRLPLAINAGDSTRPRCVECATCDGFPCRIKAKNDVAERILIPAQASGVEVADQTTVADLRLERGAVRSVRGRDGASGEEFEVRGRVVVMAAGALYSPAILLRSGLGRGADKAFLGRHLMRHCNGVVVAVFPFSTNPGQCFHKQLCFTEFYEDLRAQLGTATGVIQDVYTPSAEVLRHFAPLGLGRAAHLLAGNIQNLICIAEDDPQPENRVTLAAERDEHGLELIAVEHRYSRADVRRCEYLVTRARRVLRRAGGWPVHTRKIDTFSHALGTIRFGDSPDTGALDLDCRYWSLDNLYVTDSSFMPTSGGVNPSLTIAANALRVADRIVAAWGSS